METGLNLLKLDCTPDLNSGITRDIFNLPGTVPELNGKFIMRDNGLAITFYSFLYEQHWNVFISSCLVRLELVSYFYHFSHRVNKQGSRKVLCKKRFRGGGLERWNTFC